MALHRCCFCGWVGGDDSMGVNTFERTSCCPECGGEDFIEVEICEVCDGEGEYETTIGGDGFDGRCCAEADVYVVCLDCDGTGYVLAGEQ